MQTRDEIEGLHNCREFSQPLARLYQDMQTQEKKVFYCLHSYQSQSLVHEACTRNQSLFCKKDAFQITGFSRLKCHVKRKKSTQHARKWAFSFPEPIVSSTNFSTENLFQIRACVISARKAKHLDVTTMFTYLSCKHASRPIRARVLSELFCKRL